MLPNRLIFYSLRELSLGNHFELSPTDFISVILILAEFVKQFVLQVFVQIVILYVVMGPSTDTGRESREATIIRGCSFITSYKYGLFVTLSLSLVTYVSNF